MAVFALYFAVLASAVLLCLYLVADALVLRLALPATALVFAEALFAPDLVFAFAFALALDVAADIFLPRSVFLYPLNSFIFRPFFFNLEVREGLGDLSTGLPFLTDLRRLLLILLIFAFLSLACPFSLYLEDEAFALLAALEVREGLGDLSTGSPFRIDFSLLDLALLILAFFT